MIGRSRLLIAAALLALAQIAFLSWIIAGRAAILRNGQEVLLKVEPVDPRDLFKGDYVRLGYEIRDVPARLIENAPQGTFRLVEGPIFLRLAKDDDGFWRTRAAFMGAPFTTPAAVGEVDIRGHMNGGWDIDQSGSITVDFDIDRFYVPEGDGRQIEIDLRVRPFGILVAVAKDGTPQIKALMDGDTTLYEEPPY